RTIRADITYKRKRIDGNLIGTVPWYPLISNKRITKGRFFTGNEIEGVRNVCVISDELSRRLFTYEDPIGEIIRVRNNYYTVIGILEESATVAKKEIEQVSSLNIYIPLSTAKSHIGEIIVSQTTGSFNFEKVELHQFIVKVKRPDAVLSTAAIIRNILERFHKQMDYEIIVPLELMRQAERTKRIFNIVLGSIAAISLLVGGIGIMNIMLASVTERTREIGIRRALGARRRDIIIQFLIETVLLAGCGGVIGLALGIMIPFLITYFAEMKTIIRLWSLFISFGISICVGIIFGIYPAYRASRMNPIIALRHE
ncbi:MAG: ABC transporter permease, partial [Candidatus Sumerlaeia bacterium]|nr:ABC transporter permease [Candidatus Sumerlaeia bacterium]